MWRAISLSVFLVALAATFSGCWGGKEAEVACTDGAERCACYGNGTCNPGLVCLSGLCVADPTAPGSGGAGGRGPDLRGTGGTGLVGSGGAIAPGTGGSIGSGGSGPTGTGGRSTAGQNLIKNGDFGLGKTYWDLTWQAGQIASESYSGGEYCIRNESGSFYLSFSLGYPPTPSDAFPIEAGATYTLSYRARGFAALDLKIGQASPPYGLLVSFADTVASSVHQAQAHVFTPSTGDAAAGLVFNGTLYYYETVCFDDVVLVRN